ncbi:UNVERIFIED_CONTAM: hypothetical protein HDU68_006525, partial [Siphonaria sp. JEL0065]
ETLATALATIHGLLETFTLDRKPSLDPMNVAKFVKANWVVAVERLLLQDWNDVVRWGNEWLTTACKQGLLEMVQLDSRIGGKANTINECAKTALYRHAKNVATFFMEMEEFDPSYDGMLNAISKSGRFDLVKLFLQDPRVDPLDRGNRRCIVSAATNGHSDVVAIAFGRRQGRRRRGRRIQAANEGHM